MLYKVERAYLWDAHEHMISRVAWDSQVGMYCHFCREQGRVQRCGAPTVTSTGSNVLCHFYTLLSTAAAPNPLHIEEPGHSFHLHTNESQRKTGARQFSLTLSLLSMPGMQETCKRFSCCQGAEIK